MQVGQVAVRALQLVFVVILTGLVGDVIASAFSGNPSSVNFSMFVIVFAWLAVLYGLVAGVVTSLFIPVALLAIDAISIVLTFIAGTVLAAKLGVHSCSNSVSTNITVSCLGFANT